jgi:hypothetical protein
VAGPAAVLVPVPVLAPSLAWLATGLWAVADGTFGASATIAATMASPTATVVTTPPMTHLSTNAEPPSPSRSRSTAITPA